MRSSFAFLTAASIASLISATPLEPRSQTCVLPQQYHSCYDGAWTGCCSVSPCKGPAQNWEHSCPDDEPAPPKTTSIRATTTATSTTSKVAACTASPTSLPLSSLPPDADWTKHCKADNSNCNWNATFYSISTTDDKFGTNSSSQFYARKDDGQDAQRRDVIAVFHDIPDTVTKCSISWYKPAMGIFYGTAGDGSINISTIDTGDKTFLDTVGEGKLVTYENTKSLLEEKADHGILDLGNWGRSVGTANLNNGRTFDCKGGELVVYFAMSAVLEGAVIVDQVADAPGGYVSRAGWYVGYEE